MRGRADLRGAGASVCFSLWRILYFSSHRFVFYVSAPGPHRKCCFCHLDFDPGVLGAGPLTVSKGGHWCARSGEPAEPWPCW